MVICNYFLRGTCRFGENCKNEHTYENNASVLKRTSNADVIQVVRSDMEKAEKGNQWPFSCYGPFFNSPCFPGFEDKSFEEIRLGMYEAERNGTVEQYNQHLTHLLHEARMKMRSLKNPTPEAINALRELFNSSNMAQSQATNTFANRSVLANANSSIFGNNPPTSSTFGDKKEFHFTLPDNNQANTGSIFGQQSVNSFGTTGSIFGGQPSAHSQSIFGNKGQELVGRQEFNSNSIFSNQKPSSNIFGNSAQFGTSPPAFAQQQPTFVQPQNAQATFAQLPNAQATFASFPQPQNPMFAQTKFPSPQVQITMRQSDAMVYSKPEDLGENDLKYFQARIFEFGKIPEKPPTLQLCS